MIVSAAPARRHVGERVDGALAQPPAGDADEHRDDQRGDRIRPRQRRSARRPGQSAPRPRTTYRTRNAARRLRAPGSCVAFATRDSTRERKKSTTIETTITPKAHTVASTSGALVLDQAFDRFPDHDAGQQEQQRRFGQRRDRFDLAVPVVMLFVGRLAGDAHGDIGHHRGAEIDQRMAGFRQDRRASRCKTPTTALAIVRPADAAIEERATCSFSLLHGRVQPGLQSQIWLAVRAAAERVSASRMRMLASSWSVVKR